MVTVSEVRVVTYVTPPVAGQLGTSGPQDVMVLTIREVTVDVVYWAGLVIAVVSGVVTGYVTRVEVDVGYSVADTVDVEFRTGYGAGLLVVYEGRMMLVGYCGAVVATVVSVGDDTG